MQIRRAGEELMVQSVSRETFSLPHSSQPRSAPSDVSRSPAARADFTRVRASSNRWEVVAILGLSGLLHPGAAAKAFQGSQAELLPKRVSRVEIEMLRAPLRAVPPKPLVVPPSPKPEARKPAPPKLD